MISQIGVSTKFHVIKKFGRMVFFFGRMVFGRMDLFSVERSSVEWASGEWSSVQWAVTWLSGVGLTLKRTGWPVYLVQCKVWENNNPLCTLPLLWDDIVPLASRANSASRNVNYVDCWDGFICICAPMRIVLCETYTDKNVLCLCERIYHIGSKPNRPKPNRKWYKTAHNNLTSH